MPIIPKIKLKILPWSNLRQALQWISEEIKPVGPAVEEVLGISRLVDVGNLGSEISALFAAIIGGRIRLFGRPGGGETRFGSDQLHSHFIYFEHYGERQQISIQEISDAGIRGFDFHASRLYRIKLEANQELPPFTGWEYIDLVMLTAELLKTFSSVTDVDGRSFRPPPIDLTDAPDNRSEGPLSSQAEPGTAAIESVPAAQIEVLSLNGNRIAPGSMTAGGDRDDAKKTRFVKLSPYLQYAVWLFGQLGPDEIANRKKSDLEAEIKKHWWGELGTPSNALIRYMATMLRAPEAKQGGAKRQRTQRL